VSQPQEAVYVHWDSDIGAAGDVAIGLWIEVLSSNELFFLGVYDYVSLNTSLPLLQTSLHPENAPINARGAPRTTTCRRLVCILAPNTNSGRFEIFILTPCSPLFVSLAPITSQESGGKAFEFMDFWPFVLDVCDVMCCGVWCGVFKT